MKERLVTSYIARDGTAFSVAAECRAYELDNLPKLLVGLTEADLKAAFLREDLELAELIEIAGDRIKRERIAAGDLKRTRKGGRETAALPSGAGMDESDFELAEAFALETEGARAFLAGFGGIVPPDLTTEQGKHWLTGWDRESVKRARQVQGELA